MHKDQVSDVPRPTLKQVEKNPRSFHSNTNFYFNFYTGFGSKPKIFKAQIDVLQNLMTISAEIARYE